MKLGAALEAARSALQPLWGWWTSTLMGKGLKRLRILGLKPKRLREWLNVVDEEFKTIGFPELWHMIRGSVCRKLDSRSWKQRQRQCYRCPVFDPSLKRCRPYTGSPLGCGCYTPYRLMSPDPCLRELVRSASRTES